MDCITWRSFWRPERTSDRGRKRSNFLKKRLQFEEAILDENFAYQSDRERLALLAHQRSTLDVYLTVAARVGLPVEEVYKRIYSWKAAVCGRWSIESRVRRELLEHPHSEKAARIRQAWSELQQAAGNVRRWEKAFPPTGPREAWERRQKEFQDEKNRRERELNRLLEPDLDPTPNAARLAESLPPGTAFVDFVSYTDFRRPVNGRGRPISEERFLAFVFRPGRPPARVLLPGAVVQVHAALTEWLAELSRETDSPPRRANAAAARLAALIWSPLVEHLRGCERVFISPDGPIWGVPFAALPGRSATYLIQELQLGFMLSGRQLLDVLSPGRRLVSTNTSVVVAGIDYGNGPPPLEFAAVKDSEKVGRSLVDLFKRLPGHQSTFVSGKEATAGKVKRRLNAPHRLFVFLGHGPIVWTPTEAGRKEGQSFDHAAFAATSWSRRLAPLADLRLPLAGANETWNLDCFLATEEMATENGTPCDLFFGGECSGAAGTAVRGEGVIGMPRVLHAGGCQTVVTSLYTILDEPSLRFTEHFFESLLDKKLSKLEALRDSQLALIDSGLDDAHPRFWAFWVLYGNPGKPLPASVSSRPGSFPWWALPLGVAGATVLVGSFVLFFRLRRLTSKKDWQRSPGGEFGER